MVLLMDPNAALEEMLALSKSDLSEFGDEVHRLAELTLALDEWITKGGFMPERWRPQPRHWATDDCDHNWQLTEDGYVRTWDTEFDEESKSIVAYFEGSEDFSDQGDGDEHLQCSICLGTKAIPDGWEIDYQ